MNILTYIYEKTKPFHFRILLSCLIIMFSLVAYYAYSNYFSNKQSMKPFDNVANSLETSNSVQIYFFHAKWCPHCLNAYPEWTKFASSTNGQKINGYLVECVEVDCTGDNGEISTDNDTLGISATPAETAELIQKFNIDSYPTIKMMRNNETIEFEAKITESSLHKFVNTVLND